MLYSIIYGQARSQDFSMRGAKVHTIFSYIANIISKFSAHVHIEINGKIEQNCSESFDIEFVVETKKYIQGVPKKKNRSCITDA